MTRNTALTELKPGPPILTTANVTIALSGMVKLNSPAVANTLLKPPPPEVTPWNTTSPPVKVVEVVLTKSEVSLLGIIVVAVG